MGERAHNQALGSSVTLGSEERVIETLSFNLKSPLICAPISIGHKQPMDIISLPPNNSLGMEKFCVTVTKPQPFFSRLLEPKHFLLFEDIRILSLEVRF